jgi:uncharacterized protein YdaU (DUF1376 family)
MSLPWFPFYVDDFLASPKVRAMDAEEVGVYTLLLCEQHQKGYVEWPDPRKARALKTTDERIQYVLLECFHEDAEGMWKNHRLRQIHAEQELKSQKRAKAAKARWDKGSNANALQMVCYTEPEVEPEPDKRERDARAANEGKRAAGREPGASLDPRDPWAGLDTLVTASIRGLYGGLDREGTDEAVWRGANGVDRERVLATAVLRWRGEGHARLNQRLFRRILEAVIQEQANHDGDLSHWGDDAGNRS